MCRQRYLKRSINQELPAGQIRNKLLDFTLDPILIMQQPEYGCKGCQKQDGQGGE